MRPSHSNAKEAIIVGILPFTTTPRNPRLIAIDRDRLERLITAAIELLDMFDGDADLENLDPERKTATPTITFVATLAWVPNSNTENYTGAVSGMATHESASD